MTVLVTGASGHIGGNLVRALLDQGRAVRALVHRDQAALEGLDVELISGDVAEAESIDAAVKGADVVYHLAAVISISGREEPILGRVNVEGTGNVVDACLKHGVKRLVHFSSTHALTEHPLGTPISEENELAEGDRELPYDRSKAAGERAVLVGVEKGLDAVIVNPCGVLGRLDYTPSNMGQVLKDLYHRRLPGLVDGGYTWVDVRDVVDAAMAVEERGRTGERYILSSEWCSVRQIAGYAEAATGVKAPGFVSPMWLAQLGAPFSSAWASMTRKPARFTSASLKTLRSNPRISHEKAVRELGFSPRPVQESIADAYAWFTDTGRL